MTEEKKDELTPFDAEWEIRKFGRRLLDIMDIIDDLKAKDKSLSARISRMKLEFIEGKEEEGEDVEGEEERESVRREIEDMSLDERAVLYAKLIDRERPS